jgi:hypothetical protein
MKKRNVVLLAMLAMMLVFGLVLAGCASTGEGGTEPGRLTITGIPEEYNGKFASFSFNTTGSSSLTKIFASGEDASKLMGKIKGAVITNGTVDLLLFKQVPLVDSYTAYTGNQTVRIEICIGDTEESAHVKPDIAPDFIFASMTFQNGVAEAKLDDAFKVGFITITGIPDVYNGSEANIYVEIPHGKSSIYPYTIYGDIKNGTVTAKHYSRISRFSEDDYTPYTGTLDIKVKMGSTQSTVATDMTLLGVWQAAVPIELLFKAAQMTDDNATLDFAQGIK